MNRGMADRHKCRACGATLAGDAPSGHCPACLLKLGFAEVLEAGAPGGGFPAGSSETAGLARHDLASPSDDYELLARIGQGGMGLVYRARQKSLNRFVALKLMSRAESATPRVLARFQLEAKAAAQLDHPNIVPIHETGESEGQPWFSMKLIEGGSLAQRSSEFRVPGSEVGRTETHSELGTRNSKLARLLACVARAVHYAHQQGVLHRDLKPANILLDAAGQPYLTDFGIAKLVDEPGGLTFTADLLGTPSYMAPEQIRGRPASVASDVYSLGAILYELLTGQPPFEAATPMETMRRVAEEEPRRPTTLCGGIPRDLETICLKCLEKEPARRYSSALALAEDLERFLRREPIAARPAAGHERLWRWCCRKPALAAALAAIAVSVVLGVAGVLWQWRRSAAHAFAETQQRSRAEEALAEMQVDRAEDFFEANDGAAGLAWLAMVLRANPSNPVAPQRLVSALTLRSFPLPLAEFSNVIFAAWSPEGERVATGSKDGVARVWSRFDNKPLPPPMLHTAKVNHVEFSPDGRRLVTASDDRTARIWDAATGQVLTPALQHTGAVAWAEFSPDGQRVATASHDRTARVWDAATGQPLTPPLSHQATVWTARFSPDGRALLTATLGELAALWDAATGRSLDRVLSHRGRVRAASFSPDGRWALSAGENVAQVWEVATGQAAARPMSHPETVRSAEFSPDGERIVTACIDGCVRVWEARSARLLSELGRHNQWVNHVEFSPDGQRIVSAAFDCTVRLWDADSRECLNEFITHEHRVRRASFGPDGQSLLGWSVEGVLRIWDVRPGRARPVVLEADRGLERAHFSPDGEHVVTAGLSGLARIWDARSGLPVSPELRHPASVVWAEFNADGERLATGCRDGTVRVWNARTGEVVAAPLKHQGWVKCCRFSPDGQRLLTASHDRTARVWDARTGEPLAPPLMHDMPVSHAAFHPDGQRLVTACWDGAVRVWDARSGQLVLPLLKHEQNVLFAEFTPDGQRIVTSSEDGTGRFWDARTGQPLTPVLSHAGWVIVVRLHPQQNLAATASTDATARVWDLATGRIVMTTGRHTRPVEDVSFSPNGRWLATASDDATARVWDIHTGLLVSETLRHEKRIGSLHYSSDGRRILTASLDGTARIWDVPQWPVPAPAWLPRLAEAVGGRRINSLRQLGVVPVVELRELQRQLEQSPAGDPYTRWAKWFFADRSTRPLSLESAITVSDHVQRLLDKNTEASLRQALQFSPTNRAAFTRLSAILRTNNPSASRAAEADWCERKAKEVAPR